MVSLDSEAVVLVELGRHYPKSPDGVHHHVDSIHKFKSEATAVNTDVLIGCPSFTFWAPVTIGGERFRLIVDTGSTTLGVVAANCVTCNGRFPQYYASSTSQSLGFQVNATYGDGSGWVGNVYTDTVSMGGDSSVQVSMKFAAIITNLGTSSQSFFGPTGSGNACVNNPNSNLYQGIIGFGFPKLALSDVKGVGGSTDSYFTQNTNMPTTQQFALQLCLYTGRIWLGGYDTNYMTGSLQWITVTQQLWWVVNLQSIAVSGTTAATLGSAYTTIVDSGSTNMVLPVSVFNAVTSYITSNANFLKYFSASFFTSGSYVTLSTSVVSTLNSLLPSLTFSFTSDTGGTTTLTLAPINSYLRTDISGTTLIVYSGLQSVGSGSQIILGWAFMNQFLVVHDLTTSPPRIGFATSANCGSVAGSSSVSYAWDVSDWSICDCTVTPHVQNRYVQCLDSAGTFYTDSSGKCASTKPAVKQTCNASTVAGAHCVGDSILGPTDPCANVTCGSHGSCASGVCVCTDFYAGTNCQYPPSITLISANASSTNITVKWSAIGGPSLTNVFVVPANTFSVSSPNMWPFYLTRTDASTTAGTYTYVHTPPSPIGGRIQIGVSFDNALMSLSAPMTVADPCKSVTCASTGTCYNGACVCAVGYVGSTCATPACASGCNGHGTCDTASVACVCNSGYVGQQCELQLCVSSTTSTTTCSNYTSQLRYRFQNLNVSALGVPLSTGVAPSLAYIGFVSSLRTDILTQLSISSSLLYVVDVVADSSNPTTAVYVDIVLIASDTTTLTTLVSSLNSAVAGTTIGSHYTTVEISTPFLRGVVGGFADQSYVQSTSASAIPDYFTVEWISDHWPIIAGVVGGFIVVVLVLYCVCCRRNKYKPPPKQLQQQAPRKSNADRYAAAGAGAEGVPNRRSSQPQQVQQQQVRRSSQPMQQQQQQPSVAMAPVHYNSVSAANNKNLVATQNGVHRSSQASQQFLLAAPQHSHRPSSSSNSNPALEPIGEGAPPSYAAAVSSPSPSPAPMVVTTGPVGVATASRLSVSGNAATAGLVATTSSSSSPRGPWSQHSDEQGHQYWFNTMTGQSSWEKPLDS